MFRDYSTKDYVSTQPVRILQIIIVLPLTKSSIYDQFLSIVASFKLFQDSLHTVRGKSKWTTS